MILTLEFDNMHYKIGFAGTPYIAREFLKEFVKDEKFQVDFVITNSAKAKGRGQKISQSEVGEFAINNKIPCYSHDNLKNFDESLLKNLNAMIVIAYGALIPKKLLYISWINLHASLLPRWRGAAPIQYAILNGDTVTGLTAMLIEEKMDAGAIIDQCEIKIQNDTTQSLIEKILMKRSWFTNTVAKYLNKEIDTQAQNENYVTFANKIKKEDGVVNWNDDANVIERKIRAFSVWPGVKYLIQNTEYKLIKCIACDDCEFLELNTKNGDMIIFENKLYIVCGKGFLRILKLQKAGSKVITSEEFLCGFLSNFSFCEKIHIVKKCN